MKISVIIPTRNRPHHIERLLVGLHRQSYLPHEIIVVDASESSLYKEELLKNFSGIPITWMDSEPSVCIQRNKGIQRAMYPWIFLCDDDIELPTDYLQKLKEHAAVNPTCGALAGRLLQKEKGSWTDQYPAKDLKDLFWRFIFQLSVWGSIDHIKPPPYLKPIFSPMQKFYIKKGNSFSMAGWPLITDWHGEIFRTSTYSLGANLVKREWLLNSPYDEVLDPSGIGDNYGVALGFPEEKAIHVLSSTHAYHHRAEENRLLRPTAYFRRVLALHYFLKRHQKQGRIRWLVWSLVGNWIHQKIRHDELSTATREAIKLILTDRNPYWEGFIKNERIVQPSL